MKEREININSYFETIHDLGLENLPPVLKESHKVISEITSNGTDWSKYNSDSDFKRMMDLATIKLQQFIDTGHGMSGVSEEKLKVNNPYQTIGKEVSIIRRVLELNGKVLYKNTLEIVIDELQDAFNKKEITKKSPVAKDMSDLEKFLVSKFNSTKNAKHLDLKPATIKRFNAIIEKYENSYNDIDPTYAKAKKKNVGLQGIISSTDLATMEVPTLGFTGKWLAFIGDPCPGFKASVSGMPKMGKSFLCVDFADYLAKNHGKTLYVTKEEFMSKTFQDKLKQKNAESPNLDVAGSIPKDLSSYQSIFLDSVTRLKLSPDDLRKLEEKNPGKNFIYVHQVTKDGKARGSNEYIHNVDAVIEVPERGKAIQYGRFNQGGEMNIFEDTPIIEEEPQHLNGTKGNDNIITINATFSAPLEEFEFLIERGEPVQEAIRLNKRDAEEWVAKLLVDIRSKEKADVQVNTVEFMTNDEEGDDEHNSHYDVRLSGSETELKKIAGKDKAVFYEWKKGSESETKNSQKSKPQKKDTTKKYFEKNKDNYDSENPKFLFQSVSTPLLVDALNRKYDIFHVIGLELANRGLDKKGNWVGFDKAKKIHGVK